MAFMKRLLLFIVVLFCETITAQDFLGLQSSNYAGVNGALSNPANIVDNRFLVDISLIGLNLTAENNYFGVKHGKSLMKDTKWGNRDSNFTILNNNERKAFYVSSRITLPSFLITLNKKNAIAFNWSVRNYLNVDGVSKNLADLMYNDLGLTRLLNTRLTNKNLSIQQMAWAEYGLSYARVVKLDGPHFIKAGLTVKLLQGLEAAYVYIRDLDYLVSTKDTLSFFNTEIAYGHSDNLDFSSSKPTGIYKFTSSPGFGFDLGLVYEWRPDFSDYQYQMDGVSGLYRKDENKYKLKASLAINDIGGIRFKKGALSNDFTANVTRFNIGVFQQASDINAFDSTIKAHPDEFPSKEDKRTFTMRLPMSINAQVDYKIWNPFYVNFTANFANFFKNKESKVFDYTTISLTPRVEDKLIGFGLPLSYNRLSATRGDRLAVGAMVRFGPLILGSNNVFSYVGKRDVYGANVYFLLKIPILHRVKKDKDNDGVSDRKDKCPTVPGVWEFKGCPDRDGDHVQDSEDHCPDEPGLVQLVGCPDSDGDGISDKNDMCPDSAGTAEFKGCPDTDGDKVIDRLDECPFDAGLAEFKGCPDKDADGTPDKLDGCPETFGPKEFMGCPDSDGDKIIDKEDECPDQSGPKENKGCPWKDTDNDGVLDKDDKCPEVPGILELQGCPVSRPTEADPAPQEVPMKAAEKKIIEKAFASLEFASAKDIIKSKSLPALNALAKLMIEHSKDWKIKLSGHTDNSGDEEKNFVLSEKRTIAVQKYLLKKGVKEEQIITEWFGQTQPIEDNNTPKGRQKNRRVEMKILLKE
jgi:outer membrane protein OmpA-like peptidoglycan-associated protein